MFSFSKNAIGLEIADSSIEVIELSKKGSGFEIGSANRVRLGAGIVERGRIKDEKKLLAAVQKAFAKAKPSPIDSQDIVFGLPESQTYLHAFDTKEQNEKKLDVIVKKEAEKIIPIQKSSLILSWRRLAKTKTGGRILIAATSREVMTEWIQFFKKANLSVKAFDIENLATFRGLFKEKPKNPVCIVDMGAAATQIAIFDELGLQYAYSTRKAGKALTKEVAKALNISEEEAEEMKKQKGLTSPEEQVFPILVKVLERVIADTRKSIEYFQGKAGKEVKQVLLVGGTSTMKGIKEYFSTNLSLTVAIGKSGWLRKRTPLVYVQSVGLALRGLDSQWDKTDPMFESKLEIVRTKKEKPKVKKETSEQSSESYSLASVVGEGKLRQQKIILAAIVILGVVAMGAAVWFRSTERAGQQQEIDQLAVQFSTTQKLALEIPIAVSEKEYTTDRVKGKVVEHSITAGSYSEAVAKSRTEISRRLVENERLWEDPMSEVEDTETVQFPVVITWLIYNEKGADGLFIKEIERMNKHNVPFALNTIEKSNIRATENKDIFLLEGDIVLSINEPIQEKEQQDDQPVENGTAQEQEAYVIILETPTGLLNVREGPGVGFEAFMEVEPGEEYIFIEELGAWYHIQIDSETTGWVGSRFAELMINEE